MGTEAQTANLNFIQEGKPTKTCNNDALTLTYVSLIRCISSGHGQFLCEKYVQCLCINSVVLVSVCALQLPEPWNMRHCFSQ